MKYAQILNGQVHYIMEHDATIDELYNNYFNRNDVTFIDITNDTRAIQEGWPVVDGAIQEPAPPAPPTTEEQLKILDAEYEPQFTALTQAWATATMDGNTTLADSIKQDKVDLTTEYQAKRQATTNG